MFTIGLMEMFVTTSIAYISDIISMENASESARLSGFTSKRR
jgi:hypothetical protein